MFSLFKKSEEISNIKVSDDDIIAPQNGELIDITKVSDPVFAQKMMGESTAFRFKGNGVAICSPANGQLTVMFPTGHAFGITMNNGVELLIHIGIDTVKAKGNGFKILKKQGDVVQAGDAVVEVDFDKLSKTYDMSTMMIVTNKNDKEITFIKPQTVVRGQSVVNA